MNRKRFVAGIIILVLSVATAILVMSYSISSTERGKTKNYENAPMVIILFLLPLLVLGLILSCGELAKSITIRLWKSHQRRKTLKDKLRQASQDKKS